MKVLSVASWRCGPLLGCLIGLLPLLLVGLASGEDPLDADLRRAAARQTQAATPAPEEVDRLTEMARAQLLAGQTDQGVDSLDKAAGLAHRAGATGRSFELSLVAAEALRQQGDAIEAARRYRHAALQNPRDPRAVTAHSTACSTLARLVATFDEDFLNAYERLLEEHLATWPESAATAVVQRQRAEVLARRGDWDALLEQVAAIEQAFRPDEEDRVEQLDFLKVRAHAGLLQDAPTIERLRAAQTDLHPMFLRGTPARWVATWSPAAREAALTLATAALGRADDWTTYARQLLGKAAAAPPTPDPVWRRRAAGVQAVAALTEQQSEAADAVLRAAGVKAPTARAKLLQATAKRLADAVGTAALAAEAERLAESLATLASPETASGVAGATAMADAGRYEEALAIAAALAREKPNDRAAQSAYARLLAQSPNAQQQQEALRRWRQIEDRERRASDTWYDARLMRIELLAALGRADEAKKLAALTQLLAAPPEGSEAARRLKDQL